MVLYTVQGMVETSFVGTMCGGFLCKKESKTTMNIGQTHFMTRDAVKSSVNPVVPTSGQPDDIVGLVARTVLGTLQHTVSA